MSKSENAFTAANGKEALVATAHAHNSENTPLAADSEEALAAIEHANPNENEPMATGSLAPEEVILDAMGAYETLARRSFSPERPDGLTKTQTSIIIRLSFCGKASMTRLAGDLSVSKEHITRAIGALIDRGLVDKHRSTENFRLMKATLTEEGRALAISMRKASINRVDAHLAALSPEDREALIQASDQAAAIIGKIPLA